MQVEIDTRCHLSTEVNIIYKWQEVLKKLSLSTEGDVAERRLVGDGGAADEDAAQHERVRGGGEGVELRGDVRRRVDERQRERGGDLAPGLGFAPPGVWIRALSSASAWRR